MKNETDLIIRRLNALEQQVKIYKRCSIILLFAFASISLLTASTQKSAEFFSTITTQKLALVNGLGQTLLTIEERETSGSLSIYNQAGKEMIFLGADKSGGGGLMELVNKNGQNLVQLRTNMTGGAIKMFDANNKNVLFVGEDLNNDGAGYVSIAEKGKPKVILDGQRSQIFAADKNSSTGYVKLRK